MTALQLLWVASIIGAVLFFAAGALAMAIRRARRTTAADLALEVELRELRAQLVAARAAEDHARAAAVQSAPPVDTSRATALEGQLRDAETSATARAAQLRDAMSQLELARARVSEAESMRADYVRLSTQVNEMEFLRGEVERLTVELKAAKAIALGVRRPPSIPTPLGSRPPGSTTAALSSAIARFNDPQMRSIAIADRSGFPVSTHGEDAVELAAYAALLYEVGARANQLLPLTAPGSIEVVDEHGARVAVWPFDVADDRLLLVNLAIGATDRRRVQGMLSDVAGILGPAPEPRDRVI
jgi:hypothetical protein